MKKFIEVVKANTGVIKGILIAGAAIAGLIILGKALPVEFTDGTDEFVDETENNDGDSQDN